MCLRITVHKIESWLLADKINFSDFLKVPPARLPQFPDMESDPKKILVNVASRSRSKSIRQDICPQPESGRKVGPAYTSRLIDFITTAWQPSEAIEYSPSLRSCIDAITKIVRKFNKNYK